MKKILIVDDELNHRLMLKLHLEQEGYKIYEANDGVDALSIVHEIDIDVILLDIKMKVMDGITTLHHLKEINPNIRVIMVTAFSDVKNVVESMKLGAFDYIVKPVDIDYLKEILKESDKSEEINYQSDNYIFNGIYSDEGLGKIISLLKMVAPTDATVLITGESGTGKELIAESIHHNSPRNKALFLAVNCAAISENLVESELFGHEKGAFTGATSSKPGKFKLADKGTLFLDEVGELPLQTQAKLLRVLQEQKFEPLGGIKTISTDVRIIAATNRNLEKMVEEGTFREDLYFRLNVFPIHLPPLRERKIEIDLLVPHFIKKYSQQFGKQVKTADKNFMRKLKEYDFPGNVRELENIIERSVILAAGEKLDESLLPPLNKKKENKVVLNIKENEKNLIIEALKKTGGNKSKAAEVLGMSRRTLHNKIKEFNLEV
jgi:two-component system response regulator HydG